MQMKIQRIFTNNKAIAKDPERPLGETVPCLLVVTIERVAGGSKYTIKGRANPLPFKEFIVTAPGGIPIGKWLLERGWEEIGRNRIG